MAEFRAAGPDDFDAILGLYQQLHPDDPVLTDGSDAAAFAQILRSPGLHLFVLDLDGAIVATTYLNVIRTSRVPRRPTRSLKTWWWRKRCEAQGWAGRSWRPRFGPPGTRAATRRCC